MHVSAGAKGSAVQAAGTWSAAGSGGGGAAQPAAGFSTAAGQGGGRLQQGEEGVAGVLKPPRRQPGLQRAAGVSFHLFIVRTVCDQLLVGHGSQYSMIRTNDNYIL